MNIDFMIDNNDFEMYYDIINENYKNWTEQYLKTNVTEFDDWENKFLCINFIWDYYLLFKVYWNRLYPMFSDKMIESEYLLEINEKDIQQWDELISKAENWNTLVSRNIVQKTEYYFFNWLSINDWNVFILKWNLKHTIDIYDLRINYN
jgi:hypothetical protein